MLALLRPDFSASSPARASTVASTRMRTVELGEEDFRRELCFTEHVLPQLDKSCQLLILSHVVKRGPFLAGMTKQKPTVARLYLDADAAVRAQRIAGSVGESQAWLLSKLVAEGLRAIEANGDKVPLPLKLEVSDVLSQKETPRPKRKAA